MLPAHDRRRSAAVLVAALLVLLGGAPLLAVVSAESTSPLAARAFVSERLQPRAEIQPAAVAAGALAPAARDGWAAFRAAHPQWSAVFDRRSGALEMAEGDGIPLLPGRGNRLTNDDVAAHLGGKTQVDLQVAERAVRAFLPRVASLLGVDPASLVLDAGRSGQPTPNLWFVDYDVEIDGLAVEGARVVFRIGHGNLIQFGGENLPSRGARMPAVIVTREQAKSHLADFLGGLTGTERFLDEGSLRLLTARVDDERFAEGFESGNGRGLLPVWQLTFRRDKERETWRARIDAASGEVLELRDTNDYAQVSGGANTLGVETVRPMPFANLSSGGYTDSGGVYDYSGGIVSSTLDGQFIKIVDTCGAISQSSDVDGNILFGSSGGTNCTTPGSGGAGNTHSARTQFYHLNRAKEAARGWLPSNTWLNAQLTANVNLNQTCNAYWNGSTVNFFRSGGGCGNTGEIEAISLHEYGHGLDNNDGNGSSPEKGTGETYGDFTAALGVHDSCIGNGFLGGNCGGYGDACTACTGVRDIDWAKHVSNTPHTVANFTQPSCPNDPTYFGPCGKEGHCESYVSSEALWDFANRDLPSPGSAAAWAVTDRLWYLSRPTATSAFACTTGGTYTSNGCNAGSLWKTMRAVDDDDGNLANGTPHSCHLFAAFDRHGIACAADPAANVCFSGCTPPATPTLSLTAGDDEATASWTSSGPGVVYDVYRNEIGCDAGFIKIANDLAGTALVDTNVANGVTYYYQVVAHPSGTESCSAPPTTCMSVTPTPPPCTPPSPPANVVATGGGSQIDLTWDAVPGIIRYNLLRGSSPGGPYLLIAQPTTNSYSDTELDCGETFYYVVQAVTSPTCRSGNSSEASASTTACPPCTIQSLYSESFDSAAGLAGWTRGTFVGGGSVTDWRGVQACTAHSPANIFRFGGTMCTGTNPPAEYGSDDFNFAQPNGAGGIAFEAGSRTNRLSFWHRYDFETGYDGGLLTISLDGTNYTVVPASAILTGPYDGNVNAGGPFDCPPAGAGGLPIYTGTQSSFVETVVDLDAACDLVTGGSDGCGGEAVRIGFTAVTDCAINENGWFLDDVSVSSCELDALPALLNDGFESGTLSAWSAFTP